MHWRGKLGLGQGGGGSDVKLCVYSAHDTTLMPLLEIFGGADCGADWPDYARSVGLRVHAARMLRAAWCVLSVTL